MFNLVFECMNINTCLDWIQRGKKNTLKLCQGNVLSSLTASFKKSERLNHEAFSTTNNKVLRSRITMSRKCSCQCPHCRFLQKLLSAQQLTTLFLLDALLIYWATSKTLPFLSALVFFWHEKVRLFPATCWVCGGYHWANSPLQSLKLPQCLQNECQHFLWLGRSLATLSTYPHTYT